MKWNDFRHQAYRCASSAGFTKQPALEHHPSQQVESNLAIFSGSHNGLSEVPTQLEPGFTSDLWIRLVSDG